MKNWQKRVLLSIYQQLSTMSNYLDAADTDDEDEKCLTISSPAEIAEAEAQCAALKGDHQLIKLSIDSHIHDQRNVESRTQSNSNYR